MSKMTRKAENTTLHRPMDVTLNPGAPLLVETGLWAQLCSYLTPLKRTLWLFFPIFIGQPFMIRWYHPIIEQRVFVIGINQTRV